MKCVVVQLNTVSADSADFAEYADSVYFPISLLTLLTLMVNYNCKKYFSLLLVCVGQCKFDPL